MTSRPSTAAPILAVLAIVLPFALYVGGYFALLEGQTYLPYAVDPSEPPILMDRCYPHRWQAILFKPAAKVESWVRGYEIGAQHGLP